MKESDRCLRSPRLCLFVWLKFFTENSDSLLQADLAVGRWSASLARRLDSPVEEDCLDRQTTYYSGFMVDINEASDSTQTRKTASENERGTARREKSSDVFVCAKTTREGSCLFVRALGSSVSEFSTVPTSRNDPTPLRFGFTVLRCDGGVCALLYTEPLTVPRFA